MQQTREPQPILRLLPIGGLAAAVVGLMLDINYLEAVQGVMNRFIQQASNSETCRGEINQSVIISRDQLAAFLTISERDAKPRVQEILQSPYCYLSNVEIRAGVQAERAVYPLGFDPKTRLVVLYEGEEYAGYQFQFVPN
jgi:hypothetical protein